MDDMTDDESLKKRGSLRGVIEAINQRDTEVELINS